MAPKRKPTKRRNRPSEAGGGKIARPGPHGRNPPTTSRSRPSRLIVGLGASAGGLDAFKTFFEKMPADSGMAFVLVQHLSPDHKSALADILGKAAAVPVIEAKNGASVIGNHVYVIPPDATLTIKDRELRVVRPAPPRERRRPIDTFFDSLAEDQGENAVCIILSGTGSDGALGLKAIKESGGLTLAQAGVDHAAMSGMPQSAAATGFVDEVLPVEEMPAKLLDYQRHLRSVASKKGSDGTRGDMAEHLAKISTLLRAKLGHDFSKYKEKTMARRIQRRMQVLQIDSVPAYIARLKEEPLQLELLFRELLIGVTQFFRDPDAFAALQKEAIPGLLQNKSADEPIRIWAPGCATGEEVYSIAILVKEAIERHGLALKVQIFGTDIDENAVAFARAGRYRKTSGLSPAHMARWFAEDGEEIRPVNAIREMCVFSTHSVAKDPPFSKLDLISCRNLLIYMEAELQEGVLQTFHYALKPDGILFLGPSEGVTRLARVFSPLDKKHRIYRRLEAHVAPPELPVSKAPLPAHDHPRGTAAIPHGEDRIDKSARRALEKHSPVYLVIDRHHQIVRFSGGEAGRYLEPSSGLASLSLFGILRKSLRPIVRSAVQTARASNEPVVQDDVSIGIDGNSRLFKVIVAPIPEGGVEAGLCVVAFQDTGGGIRAETHGATEKASIDALKHELRTTKAQLQATIDELETANEEAKSSTEEYQSVNEELQSSNEELETAKEEMQSINEELHTINAEMVSKNEVLTRLNSDLRNLLDSTEIATIFLDNDLRVKSFTAGMTEIFSLRDADRGRPVTDITTLLSYPDFQKDAKKVVRSLTVIEKEVSLADEGMTFLMRIRPYRTVERTIDGIVITFVDITEREKVARALRASEQRLVAIVDQATVGVAETDLDGRFVLANARYCEMVGRSAEELHRSCMQDITHPEDWPRNLEAFHRLTKEGKSFEIEKRYVRPDGSIVWAHSNVAPVTGHDGHPQHAVTVSLDITDRKRADDHRQLMLQELNHRVKNTLATVQSVAMQTFGHAQDTVAREQFDSRLMALSRAHDILTQESWEGAPLRQIVNEAVAPHRAVEGNRFHIEGPEVVLTPKHVLALALALHELCTNAVKYGALSNDKGRVRIEWTVAGTDGARELRMQWTEMDGPRVAPPKRPGFGSRLIERGLGQDLGGEVRIDFPPTGVTCSISARLETTRGF